MSKAPVAERYWRLGSSVTVHFRWTAKIIYAVRYIDCTEHVLHVRSCDWTHDFRSLPSNWRTAIRESVVQSQMQKWKDRIAEEEGLTGDYDSWRVSHQVYLQIHDVEVSPLHAVKMVGDSKLVACSENSATNSE